MTTTTTIPRNKKDDAEIVPLLSSSSSSSVACIKKLSDCNRITRINKEKVLLLVLLFVSFNFIGVRHILGNRPIIAQNKSLHKSSTTTSNTKHLTFVLFLHYHKTGYSFTRDFKKIIYSVLKNTTNIYRGGDNIVEKRSHNPNTGCTSDFKSILSKKLNRYSYNDNSNNTVVLFIQTAPDLFCTNWNQFFLQLETNYKYNTITTKVVHFVRDPMDMALSSFLYHKQYPSTPEPWVHTHNPCSVNRYMINHTIALLNINPEEMESVIHECQRYYYHENLNKKSYYELLTSLDFYDGLRLATIQFLIANDHCGGDVLRMSNNVRKLQQWKISLDDNDIHVISTDMQEIIHDFTKYSNHSIARILDFIFDYDAVDERLQAWITQAMQDSWATKANGSNHHKKSVTHVTQGKLSELEHVQFKEKLQQDPLLGNILSKLREIIDSAL